MVTTPETHPVVNYDNALASRLFELESEAMLEQVAEFGRISRLKPSEQRAALKAVKDKAEAIAREKLDLEMGEKLQAIKDAKAKADAAKVALAEVVKSYDGFKLVARPKFEGVWLEVKDECGKLQDVASLSFTVIQKGDGSGWDTPTLVIKPKTKLPAGVRQTGNGSGGRRGVPVNVSKDGQTVKYDSRAAAYKAIVGNPNNAQKSAANIDKALVAQGYTVAVAT